jgi:hypothetical protein
MTDATMSREEVAEFLVAIKKLRDQLDIMQVYLARAEDRLVRGPSESKTIHITITEAGPGRRVCDINGI